MAKIPDNADILPPSDDRIFKVLLTHPNAKRVLMSVVSTVIERPVIDVKILNTELPISDVEEKAERFDVNCTIDSGDQVDVEMQSSSYIEEASRDDEDSQRTSLINKSIYYATDLHSSQKSKGVKYRDLVRSFQITFYGYIVFPDWPDFVNYFALRRPTGELLSDQVNLIIVEMGKLNDIFRRSAADLTDIEMWSAFFQFASDPNPARRDFINTIIEMKEEIDMASTLLMEISKDEQERARFRSRRMAETDRISNLLTVEERGRTESIALGRTRGMARVFELLEKGVSLEDAKKILGI